MTNPVHFLVTPEHEGGISSMMQALGRRYVRYFNRENRRPGTLWEGRFKSSLVQSETYLLICQRYIELNPVRAGMVDDPADYIWSSYQAHALGKRVSMHTPHKEYMNLGNESGGPMESYRALFQSHIETQQITDIRSALNKGMAFGGSRFKYEIEALHGRRVRQGKMRRPVINVS